MRTSALAKALGKEGAHPGFNGSGPRFKGVRGCPGVIKIACTLDGHKGETHQVLCSKPKGHKGCHRETEVSCRAIKHAAHGV